MSAFDVIVIGIVGLSTILAFWRGLIRAVMSLVALIAAVLAAIQFSPGVATMLPPLGDNPVTGYVAAFALIFIVVALVGALAIAYTPALAKDKPEEERAEIRKERDEVLARALQAETATGINRWLNSAGLEQSGGQLRQHLNEMTQPSERRRDRDR